MRKSEINQEIKKKVTNLFCTETVRGYMGRLEYEKDTIYYHIPTIDQKYIQDTEKLIKIIIILKFNKETNLLETIEPDLFKDLTRIIQCGF